MVAKRGSWLGKPGQWVIALYRSQIRPAIGDRCSLDPSCSEYSMQAFARHGLLGVPMTADRLVREPSVVAAGKTTYWSSHKVWVCDPLSDHDNWMKHKDSGQ